MKLWKDQKHLLGKGRICYDSKSRNNTPCRNSFILRERGCLVLPITAFPAQLPFLEMVPTVRLCAIEYSPEPHAQCLLLVCEWDLGKFVLTFGMWETGGM